MEQPHRPSVPTELESTDQPKSIHSLVEDIYELLSPDKTVEIDEEAWSGFCKDLRQSFERHFAEKDLDREPKLYPSAIGRPCHRQHWYKMNASGEAEPLRPETLMKFLIGDMYEALVLFLAKQAGHSVTGEQDYQEYAGLRGRRDAVIDGVVVDVKSASNRSYDKFTDIAKLVDNDPFGYIAQLQYYMRASDDDPLVTDHDVGGFLVVNKEMGKLHLALLPRNQVDYDAEISHLQNVCKRAEPPERAFKDVEDGKSGNRKLGVNCSYCDFKKICWPNLRTFIYSNGPRHLTNVERVPDVPEVQT